MAPRDSLQRTCSGSTFLMALVVLAVTSIAVGSALLEARNRFLTSHQSGRWNQASHAAEAGVELTLMTAQKNSWIADGWPAAPGAPGDPAVTNTFDLAAGVPLAAPTRAVVSVDRVSLGGAEWLRVRSFGQADLAGGAVAGQDRQDIQLRKLSLRTDRSTGNSVGATPRATRTLEVLAEPVPPRPFKFAFISRELFDIHTYTTADSYDSGDSLKSDFTSFATYGTYDAAKRQENGDVATIDVLSDWNLNSAHIWGDVLMPAAPNNALGATNVHGDVTEGLAFTFPDEVSPGWATVTQNHGAVTNVSKSLTGGSQATPTRHKFSSIELTSTNKNIRVQNPSGETESWVEIWVDGDVYIDAVSQAGIKIDPGVHATIHFGGRVEIKGGNGGYALSNDSKRPANLIVRAYGGSSGSVKDFILAYTDFWGVVSAPWYKVKMDASGMQIHGSFLGWQFDCSDGTNLHYDESLAQLGLGTPNTWKVRSWLETVR